MALTIASFVLLFTVLLCWGLNWRRVRGNPKAQFEETSTRWRRFEIERLFGDAEALQAARRATQDAPWALVASEWSPDELRELTEEGPTDRARQALIESMAADDEALRSYAFSSYKVLFSPPPDEVVRLVDRLPTIRFVIIEALGTLFSDGSESVLFELLEHESRKVRNVAAEGLSHVGSPRVIDRLLWAVEAENPSGISRFIGERAVARIQRRHPQLQTERSGIKTAWAGLSVADLVDRGELSPVDTGEVRVVSELEETEADMQSGSVRAGAAAELDS